MSSNLFQKSTHCANYATGLLKRLHINELPIDPYHIASTLNIKVIEEPMDGFDGCLLPDKNGNMNILVNAAIEYETKKRFTLAHELGHFEIPHHTDSEYRDMLKDVGYGKGNSPIEKEANEFASELLMPTFLIEDIVKFEDVGFDTIKRIADDCKTSLTSSAFTYVKLSSEICGFVIAENRKIKSSILSGELRSKGIFFEKGDGLSRNSLAYSFFDDDGKVLKSGEESDEIDRSAWMSELEYSEYDFYEHTLAFDKFDQTFSLIWAMPKDTIWE